MEQAIPDRRLLWRSVRRVSSLSVVAEAVADASQTCNAVHLERWSSGWRWSPAHRGGGYPLLRTVARHLNVEHHLLILPFDTNADGYAFVPHRGGRSSPIATISVEFTKPLEPDEVRRLLGSMSKDGPLNLTVR